MFRQRQEIEDLIAYMEKRGLLKDLFLHIYWGRLIELTPDESIEIFKTVLVGRDDLTKDLLIDLTREYSTSLQEVLGVEVDGD